MCNLHQAHINITAGIAPEKITDKYCKHWEKSQDRVKIK